MSVNKYLCGCGHLFWHDLTDAAFDVRIPCPKCNALLNPLQAGMAADLILPAREDLPKQPDMSHKGPMHVLALVTARGGSKRLPGKNTAWLDGKPMVWHSWRVLNELRKRRPGITLRLSTDSQEIADCWPGADFPSDLRPAELATDEASSMSVIAHEMRLRPECNVLLLLQPTSPLVSVEDLDACLVGIEAGHASMVGVTKMSKPSSWAMQIADQGCLQEGAGARGPNRDHDCHTERRMVDYVPMGIWAATRTFLDVRKAVFVAGDSWPVIVPPERAVDIDTQMDLDVARMLMARRREEAERVVWNTVTTDGH